MTKFLIALLIAVGFCFAVNAQTASQQTTATKPKKIIFRANKDQVTQAQKLLKTRGFYGGAETGKLDTDTRSGLKKYQAAENLPATGTLNRMTLEKMNVALTDKQKAMPIPPPPKPKATSKSSSGKSRSPIFRATKDQITAAQKMMKEKGFYAGTENGKLDADTRGGIKKFQAASGVKATGTLNRATLEKMGIELTDKQKETPK